MVISTGMIWPALSSVAALYCRQNSMVCTPWGPRAVPTGGAGVAFPAGSWIFTMAATRRLAMNERSLQLRDLRELELDGCLPSEDVDENLQLELVLVDLGDGPGEVGERPFLHPHRLSHVVLEAGPAALDGLTFVPRLDLQNALHFPPGQWRGTSTETDEA